MALAEGGAALAASATASRPRGRRQRGWPAVLCFGSRGERGEAALAMSTPWARRKRTVPVDGELVAPPDGREASRGADEEEEEEEEEAGKGPRARGCCFLPPARVPGRKDGKRGGSKHRQHERTKQKHARPQDDPNPPSRAPDVRRVETGVAGPREPTRPPLPATPRDGADGAKAGGVGAFGPATGPSVVAAVSMAGLLGGRLWAVVCVCAWLVALSRLSVAPCAGPRRHRGRE